MSECSFPGQNSSWKRTSWGKDFLGKECGFHWPKLFANLMVCHLINMIVCFCDWIRTLLVLLSCSLLTRSLYIYVHTYIHIFYQLWEGGSTVLFVCFCSVSALGTGGQSSWLTWKTTPLGMSYWGAPGSSKVALFSIQVRSENLPLDFKFLKHSAILWTLMSWLNV